MEEAGKCRDCGAPVIGRAWYCPTCRKIRNRKIREKCADGKRAKVTCVRCGKQFETIRWPGAPAARYCPECHHLAAGENRKAKRISREAAQKTRSGELDFRPRHRQAHVLSDGMHARVGAAGARELARPVQNGLERAAQLAGNSAHARLLGKAGKLRAAVAKTYDERCFELAHGTSSLRPQGYHAASGAKLFSHSAQHD